MFPVPVAVAFTVLFGLTGAYALLRYVRISAGPSAASIGGVGGEARVVELLHLVMSIAMIGMSWGLTGGPTSVSGIAQLVLFGVLALVFVRLAVGGRVLARGSHAMMAAAMVWMVATMPLLMGHTHDTGGDEAGHGHHGGADTAVDPGTTTAMPPMGPPAWVVVITVVLAVVTAASAVFWVARAVRAARALPAPSSVDGVDAPSGGAEAPAGSVATLTATTRSVAAPSRVRGGVLPATCHALMSVGMAAMLLLML